MLLFLAIVLPSQLERTKIQKSVAKRRLCCTINGTEKSFLCGLWSLLSCRLVIAKRDIDHVTPTPVLKNLAINWTHIVSTSSGQLLSDTTCTSHTVITGAQDKLSISCYHLPFLPYCKGHSISRRKQNLPTSIARLF